VAGPGGADIDDDSTIHSHLVAAIQRSGDALVPVRVQSYRNALFQLTATITIDPDYEMGAVLAAVEQALRTQFGFDARDFAQPAAWASHRRDQAVRGVSGEHHSARPPRRRRVAKPGYAAASNGLDQRRRHHPSGPSCSLDPGPIQLAGGKTVSFDVEKLAGLLPAIYRIRDTGQDGVARCSRRLPARSRSWTRIGAAVRRSVHRDLPVGIAVYR
jgi:hypothetical protein